MYLKLKHDTFGSNMKVLLGHLDWALGTKGLHSDLTNKTFLGLDIGCHQYFQVVKPFVKHGVKTCWGKKASLAPLVVLCKI